MRHLRRLTHNPFKRYIALAAFILVFGGLGVYLLLQSRAATEDTNTPALLSLLPEKVTLQKGDIVNMYVNLEASANTGNVTAVINYPADSMRLDALHDLCPKPNYREISHTDNTAGQVAISCARTQIAAGRQTLGSMAFVSTKDGGDQQVTISDQSKVGSTDGSGNIIGRFANSAVTLSSAPPANAKQKRATANNGPGLPLCASKPGQPECGLVAATDRNNHVVVESHGTSGQYYGPSEIHKAYQLPCYTGSIYIAARCATPNSFGPENIVIVVSGNYASGVAGIKSDFSFYNQYFGIPDCTQDNGCLTIMNQSGQASPLPGVTSDAWSSEVMLDLTAAHMVCQTCKITLVEAGPLTTDMNEANDFAARNLNPTVISNSWSSTDSNFDYNAYTSYYDHPGIPIIAIPGDFATANPGEEVFPASYPQTISVAGTNLAVNNDDTWAKETVWTSSGGGCSRQFDAASWQAAYNTDCNGKRSSGDISLDGDPATGIYVYIEGKWQAFGGTSLSAPLLAGMYGLVGKDKFPADQVGAQGIYKAAKVGTNLHDITQGNNCTANVTDNCTAGVGFDVPSGLGAPIGLTVIGGQAVTVPPTPTPPTPTPPTPTPPTPTPPTPTPPTPTPPTTGKTGDLNGDGKVNLTDLSILLKNYNKAGTSSTGDLNNDGKVNLTDLSILLKNYGK